MIGNETHDTNETPGARLTDDDPRVQALAEAIFASNQAAADMEWAEYQRHCVEWCERNAGELFDLREQNAALVAEVARLEAANDANERHLRLPLQRHIELLAAAEAQVDEMRPLVVERVKANAAPTPEPDWRDDADELKWLHDPDAAPDGPEGGDA